MNDLFSSIELYLSFAWWQSTVVLAAALAGSWFFRRFPWRAQTLLLLGVLGAGAVPGISIFCAEAGWGIFSSVPEMVAEPIRLEPTRLEPARLEPARFEEALVESDMVQPNTVPNEIGSETAQADAVQAETVFSESEPSTEILSHTQSSSVFLLEQSKWLFWKGTVWGLAITGGLLMAMLVIGLFGSRVLLSHARPVADPAVQGQIEQVAEKLGRRRSPLLFTSDAVSGPTIWGWGIHPCLLFPKGMLEGVSSQVRDAIFLHELAHLVRFDHVSSFLIQLLGCLLFWNPLYWLIRRRSELCSDQACDAIALFHAPIRPDSYADMIVQMAASRRRPAAFLFLSRKEKIMERVKNVLDFGQSPSKRLPRNSKLWTTTVVTLFLGTTLTIALMQERKAEAAKDKAETVETVHLGPKPRPIKIEPPVGATDVDPELKEIRITFDRDMDTACFAWCVRNGRHPKVAGEAKWVDARTCVVPVKLEKGQAYFWLINVGEFNGFRSIDGVPSVPTPAYFCTKGAKPDLLKQMTPPEVVSLSVPNGATNVPPGRTRLSVTFDMPMSGHVYFEEGPDSPKFVDKAGGLSPDRKTRTMFADLKPGREYTIYLNSSKHQNYGDDFANQLGVSLKPYVWKFSTAAEPATSSKDQAETTETVHLGLNPRPIKIEPAVGAIDVDPGLKEIRVTFDRDMERGAHSWCGGGPRFPETTGRPKWIDARTCVLPVKFEEGQAYFLSLNTPRFEGFRSFDGWPAIPTPVYFCTKGASADLVKLMTPPEVVSVSIPNGATGVQPGETQLSVTFNVPMGGGMSWCSLSTAMKLEGSTWSDDRKTCTTIAHLDPGHEFRISLNSPRYQNFRNELGLPLKPYLWTFSTSGEPSQTGGEFKTPLGDYTHLTIFKPVGDFDPQTPMELLHELHEKFQRVGGIRTGFFRTWPKDGRLVGGICTSTPDLLEKAIKDNSDLQWISTDRLSKESFEKHEKRQQESMPGVFIAGGNHTHLTIFKPVDDFEPQTPMELLQKLDKTLLKSKRVRTGWFRTWSEDGRLFGGICTGNPGGLEEVLEKIPELELVRTERLTKESFEKHESREQESMPGVFIAEGNHTHLTIFKPVGDFEPQTPMKLLQKLNKTLSKSKRVRTGWFRTWSEDGRLFGGICTGNPGGLEEVLEKIPELELVRTERLTKESFEKHESREQESMPGALKAQSKHTHLTIFKPVGDFDPQTPMELFQKLTMNLTNSKRAWTGWFRTWSEDGRLFGGICTVNPKGLEEFLEKIPELELVRTERLTKESFEKHEKRKQESMPGIFITWGNYTHLTIFKPIGDFQPKTPKELFDELHATFHKVDGIRTGWFRAWQKDGRLVGGICTNTPDALKKAIEENSDLQWISTDWLTLESFKKHEKRRHKPLSGAPFIAEGKHTHLTIFKPVGDFQPKTPKELLDELHATFHKVGGIRTGWFRTWPKDGRLVGGICTSTPDALKKAIEENPELEWISTDRLTKESFEKHEKRQQESLQGVSIPEVKYTHLAIFKSVGDFRPQRSQELLDELQESFHKTNQVRIGCFRTWPASDRLVGGICTNDPEGLGKVIEENPDLKLVTTRKLTKKLFERHSKRQSKSLE